MNSDSTLPSEGDPPAIAPLARGRIPALDILRGGAVLGILLANITAYAHPSLAYYWPPALLGGVEAGGVGQWLWLAQLVLIDGKMRGIFTILFGASLMLFIEKAGSDGARLQVRRLAWLALIGLGHFYLLFWGDILWSYAAAGVVCVLASHLPARALLGWGIVGAAAGACAALAEYGPPALVEAQVRAQIEAGVMSGGSDEWVLLQREWASNQAAAARELAAMTGPSLRELLWFRVREDSYLLIANLHHIFLETVPLMLIGMGLLRAGLFADAALRARWRRRAVAALALGLGATLAAGLAVLAGGFPPYLTRAVFFGVLPVANLPLLLGAFLLLVDWAMAAPGGWLGQRLAKAGRMALSNYVGTSLVMALIFQGWAGGLFGQLHRAQLLVVVALGWALMLTGSHFWLARFRQGPLEWLWRCLTYGKVFPNRL